VEYISRQLRSGMDGLTAMRTLLKGTAMQIIVGPVLTRKGGYAFDCWTPEEGLSCGYTYGRIEDAHYARKVEISSRARSFAGPMVACSTLDEFSSVLAKDAGTGERARTSLI